MSNYHTRIVVLSYAEDSVPEFADEASRNAWYAALGRQVAYGLFSTQNPAKDHSTQLVNMTLNTYCELQICAHYYTPVLQIRYDDGCAKFTGTPDEALSNLTDKLMSTQYPLTIGAVLHQSGEWGFHS